MGGVKVMRFQQNKQHFNNDRRLNWDERRSNQERRNQFRVQLMPEDCRRGVPRRESDLTGISSEADVWWELEYPAI